MASPDFSNYTSNYMEETMRNNLHASTSCYISNMQYVYLNSHASATSQLHMSMTNMMSSINHCETRHVRSFNGMQEGVSPFYSSVINSQHVSPNMLMDVKIWSCHYQLFGYPSSTLMCYTSYHYFLAPYKTIDIHNLTPHLHGGHSRISGNCTGSHIHPLSTVPYYTPPRQLQSFGNTHISLPKQCESNVCVWGGVLSIMSCIEIGL